MTTTLVLLLLSLYFKRAAAFGLLAHRSSSIVAPYVTRRIPLTWCLHSTSTPGDNDGQDDDESSSEEGASLAADFFKALENRNIELSEDDFFDEDEDDEDDDEEDEDDQTTVRDNVNDSNDDEEGDDVEEINIPDGAVKAFADFDENAGNVTLTNEEVYSALKERVLESAGAFIDLVGTADDDDDDDDESDEGGEDMTDSKPYVTPKTVPDSGLTAGEVVTTVLDALCHNDTPTEDRGIEVLFGYSSPGSIISQAIEVEGMTASEYGDFLKEDNEYQVLFDHTEVIIDKGDYSFDKKKSFFTARLKVGDGPLDFTSVNFILSTNGQEEDDCWLVDSLMIRPKGMRRNRRR